MRERIINQNIAKNIKSQLSKNRMNQRTLAKQLGVSPATVSTWIRGEKMPRADKIDALCSLFHITRADLLDEQNDRLDDYYLNPQTRLAAKMVYEDANIRSLFEVARTSSPDDIRFAIELLNRLKR